MLDTALTRYTAMLKALLAANPKIDITGTSPAAAVLFRVLYVCVLFVCVIC